jgi:hypothetical protein
MTSGHFCDVALDTEVFNGHTTSRFRVSPHARSCRLHNCCVSEMLWMGLPLISAINSTQPFGRLSAGLLKSSSITEHPPTSSSSHVLSPWQPVRSAALSSFPSIALPPSVLLARDLNEFVHPLHFYCTKQNTEALFRRLSYQHLLTSLMNRPRLLSRMAAGPVVLMHLSPLAW